MEARIESQHATLGDFELTIPLELRATGAYVSAFTIDRDGTQSDTGPYVDSRARVGLSLERNCTSCLWGFRAVYQHEFISGTMLGRSSIEGEAIPHSNRDFQKWHEGYVEVSYDHWARLTLGLQTNRWGLGLLANDSDHGAEFGSGRFSIPIDADRNLRAGLIMLPFFTTKTRARGLAVVVAVDRVWEDANARYLDDDDAYQGIGAIKWVLNQTDSVGAYAVRRLQRDASGREVRVTALDATGQVAWEVGPGQLVGGFEIASIRGTTTRAPTLTYPSHDVDQFGGAATAGYEGDDVGAWVDFIYASGDQNPFDADQNAFYANRSFDMGMLMFEQVVAYHSGRSVYSTSNPNFLGVPPDDVRYLASDSRVTNAIVVSPRGSYRPLPWLETYARPIFAWTAVPWTDPFNTNIHGGVTRNSLDASPGRYYGTELDFGVRAIRTAKHYQLTTSLETGVVFPGSAFALPQGGNLDPIYGARLNARVRF
jgi:hypothetical protein